MIQRPFCSLVPVEETWGTFLTEDHIWFLIKLRSARGILWRVALVLNCESVTDRPNSISIFLRVKYFSSGVDQLRRILVHLLGPHSRAVASHVSRQLLA
jgi:hypothetical protein